MADFDPQGFLQRLFSPAAPASAPPTNAAPVGINDGVSDAFSPGFGSSPFPTISGPDAVAPGSDGMFYGLTDQVGPGDLDGSFGHYAEPELAPTISGPDAVAPGSDGMFYGLTDQGGPGHLDGSFGHYAEPELAPTISGPDAVAPGSDGMFFGLPDLDEPRTWLPPAESEPAPEGPSSELVGPPMLEETQVAFERGEKLAAIVTEADSGMLSYLPGSGMLADAALEKAFASIPAGERRAALDTMPEGYARTQAEAALEMLEAEEEAKQAYTEARDKKIAAGAASFDGLAKSQPKADPKDPNADPGALDDAKKQHEKKVQAAVAAIPYADRERALAAMSDEARALAQSAFDKKREEMSGKASTLFKAINAGMLENGTDTTTILQTLATLTPDERAELEIEYGKLNMHADGTPRDLRRDLEAEFEDEKSVIGTTKRSYKLDREFIDAVFSDDTVEQKAIALQLAARGSSLTDCTDEALFTKTLESITDPAEREAVFEEFKRRQEKAGESVTDIEDVLRSEMVTGDVDDDDYEYKRNLALARGEFEEAKAVEAAEAMDPGVLGHVTIRDGLAIATVLPGGSLVSAAATVADAAGVIDVSRKMAEPDTEKAAQVYASTDSQAQRDRISEHFAEAHDGKSMKDIAEQLCPEPADAVLVDAAAKNDKDKLAAARWKKNASKLNSDEQGMMKQIEGERYAQVIATIDEVFGEGEFERTSKKVMNADELAANAELAEGGKVKPLTGVLAATSGVNAGWALEDIERHLRDPKDPKKLLSAADMTTLKEDLCRERGITAEEFDALIDVKLGGKDAFRLRQMLKGEPATREERLARAKEEHDFNRGGWANAPGKLLTDSYSTAGEAQDAQYAKLVAANETITELEAKRETAELTEEEAAKLADATRELEERTGLFSTNVSNYQAARDTISNDVTTIAAATAGAVATVATGGAMGPVVGAILAGLTTIASKKVLLGDTYNERDQAKDELQALLSVGAAGASVAAGPAIELLAGRLGAAAGSLLSGPQAALLKDLVAAGAQGAASGALNGALGTVSTTLLDEKLLQGKGDVGDLLTKALFATLSSTVAGGVSGVAGKGLDAAGLQSADPTKQYSTGSHFANKAVSTVAGDAAGFAVDPANHKGPDAFGKFLQKEAMAAPSFFGSTIADKRKADRLQLLDRLGYSHADLSNPTVKARVEAYEAMLRADEIDLDLRPDDLDPRPRAQRNDLPDDVLDRINASVDANQHELLVDAAREVPGFPPQLAARAAAVASERRLPIGEAAEMVLREEFGPRKLNQPKQPTDRVDLDALLRSKTDGPPLDLRDPSRHLPDPTTELFDRISVQADFADLLRLVPQIADRDPDTGGDRKRAGSEQAVRDENAKFNNPERTERLLAQLECVLRGDEGTVAGPYPHPSKQLTLPVESRRYEPYGEQQPVIRVATGERVIMQMPEAASPTLVSTHFENCGATVIRGIDNEGRMVVLMGHAEESAGHGTRFAQDLEAMRALGIKPIEIIAMPSIDDSTGDQLTEALQAQAAAGVNIRTIARPRGASTYAHVMVTKDGVTVFEGDLKEAPPEVLTMMGFEGTM